MSDRPTGEEVQGALEVLRPAEQALESRPGALMEAGIYDGIAAAPFTDEQQKILLAPVDRQHVSWKPSMRDGPQNPEDWAQAMGKKNHAGKPWRPPLAFVEQVQYRRRLNAAFGPGGWGIRLLSPPKIIDQTVVFHGGLYVLGRFVAESFGEQDYYESNANQSWATALESAKSDCLTRCCKDLGMFSELWEKRFLEGLLSQGKSAEKPQDERKVAEPVKETRKAASGPPAAPAKPRMDPERVRGTVKSGWLMDYEWIQFLELLHAGVTPEQRQLSIDWLYESKHRNPLDWWRQTSRLMAACKAAGIDHPTPPECVAQAAIDALEDEEPDQPLPQHVRERLEKP